MNAKKYLYFCMKEPVSSVIRCRILCVGLIGLLLVGCVQTTSSGKRPVDKEKALESYITLGMAYLKQGNRDASRRNFEKALEINSRSHEAHNGMGLLYQLTGETELAEKSFIKALNEESGYTAARVNYGVFLYQQQRYQQAYTAFDKAAKDLTYNRRALVLAYVGQAADRLGDKARAKSAFEHSLSVDKNLALPMIELAQVSFDEEDYTSAKNYLDQYLTIAKCSPKSLWSGIRIERIFGNKDKEASYVLALKNLYPYSKEYLEYKTLLDKQVQSNER